MFCKAKYKPTATAYYSASVDKYACLCLWFEEWISEVIDGQLLPFLVKTHSRENPF